MKKYNKKIHDWVKTMQVGKWYKLTNIKMDRNEFIGAIQYLIDCGAQITFNEDYTEFKREYLMKENLRHFHEHDLIFTL